MTDNYEKLAMDNLERVFRAPPPDLADRLGGVPYANGVSLQAFGTSQINDVVGQISGLGSLTEGQVVVTVTGGSGRIAGAVSMVDGISQDPTTLALQPR